MNRDAYEIKSALRSLSSCPELSGIAGAQSTIDEACQLITHMNADLRRQGVNDYNDKEEE